jgi:hypothetical protein
LKNFIDASSLPDFEHASSLTFEVTFKLHYIQRSKDLDKTKAKILQKFGELKGQLETIGIMEN